MAKPVVLPPDIIQAIEMIRSTPVDPNDFNNAVQECYNRGFGKMGKWIAEHKDLYLQALQDGYVSETAIPKSEPAEEVPPAPEPENIDPMKSVEPTEDIPPMEIEADVSPDGEELSSGKRHKRQ
jgi:hypothetical protein